MAVVSAAQAWAADTPDAGTPAKAAKPPAKVAPVKRELTPPSYLPEMAREYLHRRMERHGRDMQELMFSVVLLTREVARDCATRIATEPRLARPEQSDEDTLNRALPPRFFVLQDELRDRAKKVADAATTGTDQQLGAAYAKLTETCIACHSVYLNP
ncbi:MAG: hypothetical protein QM723_39030 [Myxococcaceae bacterium]